MYCLLVMAGLLSSCTKNTTPKSYQGPKQDYGRLPFVIQDNYTYSLFYQGLTASGYSDTLAGEAGPFTVLVPNNDAMTASSFTYPNNNVNYFLQAYDPSLKDYIRYLILRGKVAFSALPLGDNQTFPTLEGLPVYISKYLSGADTVITVNGIKVVATDIPASNGLVEVISAVPEPGIYPNLWQRMQHDGSLVFFTAAIQRAGLQSMFETPGDTLTVFAPSNTAFIQFVGALNGYPNLYTVDSIRAADPALLKRFILEHVMKGIRFTNDLVRADSIPGDTVLLSMYNGGILKYTQNQFASNALTHDIVRGVDPVTGLVDYGPYGSLILPSVTTYYSEAQFDLPPVVYKDRVTGNGVLHELSNIMLP
jgi:uncharacterized surface protein with fasciclin (FAS1) repeats